MNCHKAKELLLTDAVDCELTGKLKEQLSAHLESCQECRKLRQDIESDLSILFRSAAAPEVPESLWKRIERKIQEEETLPLRKSVLSDLSFKIKEVMAGIRLMLPRPAVGLSAALVMIMAVFFMARPMLYPGTSAYLSEQAVFLAGLGSTELSAEQAEATGWDMPEEIFL